MSFKRFFKPTLLSTLIISTSALSADLAHIKSQASSFSHQLSSFYQANSTTEDFQISKINHQYLFNHGLIFTINTNVTELIADQTPQAHHQSQQEQIQHNNSNENNLSYAQSTNDIAKLRLTARNLAHQEFSLQKQIDSMQAMSLQSDEQNKSSIDKSIRMNQDKLNNLIKQRAEVSQQIANKRMQQTMSDSTLPPLSRSQLYKTMLKQTYQLLCADQELDRQLTDDEKLTVIFKGLGEADEEGYKDSVVSIDKSTLEQCSNNEISLHQAINKSKKYQY